MHQSGAAVNIRFKPEFISLPSEKKYNQIVSSLLVLHEGSSDINRQCRVGIWFVSLVHVKSLHHYTVPMKILPEKTVQS